ncbi:hypothetical protein CEXT_77541 [Caerostris extrusa]|uniref:Uncharacterized protein n=1 Tax=Caerostris extrusa TaxID=172846 RepID=A0AAV4N699_CAEEX|nr:hypothetical protein CEXT_77541 [Caerostris extrusa]
MRCSNSSGFERQSVSRRCIRPATSNRGISESRFRFVFEFVSFQQFPVLLERKPHRGHKGESKFTGISGFSNLRTMESRTKLLPVAFI